MRASSPEVSCMLLARGGSVFDRCRGWKIRGSLVPSPTPHWKFSSLRLFLLPLPLLHSIPPLLVQLDSFLRPGRLACDRSKGSGRGTSKNFTTEIGLYSKMQAVSPGSLHSVASPAESVKARTSPLAHGTCSLKALKFSKASPASKYERLESNIGRRYLRQGAQGSSITSQVTRGDVRMLSQLPLRGSPHQVCPSGRYKESEGRLGTRPWLHVSHVSARTRPEVSAVDRDIGGVGFTALREIKAPCLER